MKKSLVLALVAVMSLISVESQAKWLGIKAGANISSLTGTDLQALSEALNSAASFQGGLAFNFGFGEKKIISLQPEVLISFKDAKLDLSSAISGNGSVLTMSTTRLEVPVNLQAGINLGKLARIFIQAGPYFSYILSDNAASLSESLTGIAGIVDSYDVNKFDWGIGVGAGVDLFSSFQLALKYDFGISELKSSDAKSLWAGMKNRNFSISLAWFFL